MRIFLWIFLTLLSINCLKENNTFQNLVEIDNNKKSLNLVETSLGTFEGNNLSGYPEEILKELNIYRFH